MFSFNLSLARAPREAVSPSTGLSRSLMALAIAVAATSLGAVGCGGGGDSIDDDVGSPSTIDPTGGTSSNGDGETPGTCMLWATLSGALPRQFNGDDLVGCKGNGYATSPNLDVAYGLDGGSITDVADRFRIRVNGVQKGDSGQGFKGQVIVSGPNDAVWQTSAQGCTFAIEASERYAKDAATETYQVTGSASCQEQASGVTGTATGSVVIGDFDFSAPVKYAL